MKVNFLLQDNPELNLEGSLIGKIKLYKYCSIHSKITKYKQLKHIIYKSYLPKAPNAKALPVQWDEKL